MSVLKIVKLKQTIYIYPPGKSAIMAEVLTIDKMDSTKAKNCSEIVLDGGIVRAKTIYGVDVWVPLSNVLAMIPLEDRSAQPKK
mgnify:CR=1 FL=1